MKFRLRDGTYDEYILHEQPTYFDNIKPKKTDIWLDAGANIGCFSVLLAPKVKEVIAYEPELDNFRILKGHLTLNRLTNVKTIRKAIVGNLDVVREFHIWKGTNKGLHSFFKFMPDEGLQTVTVACDNINDTIKKYKINKIKMDVEGAEQEILEGMTEWDKIEEMIFEYHYSVLKKRPLTFKSGLVKMLRKHFKEISISWGPKGTQLVYAHKGIL